MTAFTSRTMLRAAAASCASAVMLAATAATAADATGVWLNDTGRGAVEIKDCGGALCGHVVWVKDGGDAKGCGRQIIGNAKPVKSGLWDNGWIYSPERKKRYDVELKPLDENRLRVTGYAGSKFFSKTMIWKRAPADLERCGTEVAKADTAPAVETKPAEAKPDPAAKTPEAETSAKQETASTSQQPAIDNEAPQARLSPEAKLRAELNKEPQADKAASNDSGDDAETETASADGPDLGGLKLDKYLKRSDGNCKLDLPWVKVDFKCPE